MLIWHSLVWRTWAEGKLGDHDNHWSTLFMPYIAYCPHWKGADFVYKFKNLIGCVIYHAYNCSYIAHSHTAIRCSHSTQHLQNGNCQKNIGLVLRISLNFPALNFKFMHSLKTVVGTWKWIHSIVILLHVHDSQPTSICTIFHCTRFCFALGL